MDIPLMLFRHCISMRSGTSAASVSRSPKKQHKTYVRSQVLLLGRLLCRSCDGFVFGIAGLVRGFLLAPACPGQLALLVLIVHLCILILLLLDQLQPCFSSPSHPATPTAQTFLAENL